MNTKIKGFIYILITALIWSTLEVFSKTIIKDFTPMQLTFLRFFVGSMILIPFACYEMNRQSIQIEKQDWKKFVELGLISIVFSMVFLQMAVKYTNASIVAVIFSSNSLFAAPLAMCVLKEKLNRKALITLGLGVCGLLVIVNPFHQNQNISLWGITFSIVAAISFALFTVMGRKMAIKYSSIIMNAFSSFFGVLMLSLILLLSHQPILQGIDRSNIIWLLFLGIVHSGIAYILYFKGIHYTSVATGGLTFFLKPVFAFIFASILLQEPITTHMITGTIIIFTAFFLKFKK